MSKSSLIVAASPATLVLAALMLSASMAQAGPPMTRDQAQNQAQPAPAAADPVDALLRGTAGQSAVAPAEPDPEERVTRALNAEILAQSELTDQERRAQAEAEAARYREQTSAVEAETARLAAAAEGNDAAYRDALARHERAMADWRATSEACRRGQTTRCRAGKAPALPGN